MHVQCLLLFATVRCAKILTYAQGLDHFGEHAANQITSDVPSLSNLQPFLEGTWRPSTQAKTIAAFNPGIEVKPESELSASRQCALPSRASNPKVKRESQEVTYPPTQKTEPDVKDNLDAKNFNLAIGFGVFGVVSCICTIIGTIAALKWRKSSSVAVRRDAEREASAASSRAASLGPQYDYSRVEERWIRMEDRC